MNEEARHHRNRIPDVEVLVQAAQSDVALVSFHIPTKIHGEVEVVVCCSDNSQIGAVRAVLQAALQALYTQSWFTVDDLAVGASSGLQEPPF